MLDLLLKNPAGDVNPKRIIKVSDRADKPIKSLIKAISWRAVGTIDTMIISYLITGRMSIAFSIGSIEVFSKTILYYFHERLWSHIHRLKIFLPIKSEKKQYEIDRVESES